MAADEWRMVRSGYSVGEEWQAGRSGGGGTSSGLTSFLTLLNGSFTSFEVASYTSFGVNVTSIW